MLGGMDGTVVGTALACALVTVLAAALQRYAGHRYGRRVAEALRDLPLGPTPDPVPHPDPDPDPAQPTPGTRAPAEDLALAVWQQRLYDARTTHLETIRSVAGKWRDAFAGLLGLFGAVLVLGGTSSFADVPEAARRPLFVAMMLTLVLALNATFYAGWAATGGTWSGWARLTDPAVLRDEQNAHAGRSLFRLRVGLVCGGLALVGAVAALGIATAGQLPR